MINENRKIEKKRLAYNLIPIFISCIISLSFYFAGWLNTVENQIHENEFHLARTSYNSNIVIVEIDSVSLKAMNGWPWPRQYYANAINNLLEAQAKFIFLDIDFSAHSKDDDILAESLKQAPAGTILMPAFLQYSNSGDSKYLTLNKPNENFREYATPVSVNLIPDNDGLVRKVELLSEFAGELIPTAAVIFNNYPAKLNEHIKLNLRISPDSFEHISFNDIYENNFNHALLKDKYVIIGATALELSDQIALPVYKSLAGPVVQAIIYQSLVNGTLKTSTKAITTIILILFSLPVWFLFSTPGWRKGFQYLIAINIAILTTSIFTHLNYNFLLDITPFILFITLSYTFMLFAKIDSQIYKIISQKLSLRNKEELMTHVIKNTSEGIIILDKNLNVTTVNSSAKTIFGVINNELLNASAMSLFPDLGIKQTPPNKKQIETIALHKNKHTIPVEITLNQISLNKEIIYTLFIHDISERKARQANLTYQATHDSLTGIHNRAHLLATLKKTIESYKNDNKSATLIMIDLNNFKDINDTLGHNTGDKILITLGKRLNTFEDDNTCVARLGGDEFSILTSNIYSKHYLDLYIARIQKNLSKPIILSGMSLTIDAAIGVAHIPEHATTENDILIAADVAMYKSKRNKESFSIYDPQSDYHAKKNLAISNDIKQALNNNQILLYYQPKVDIKTNKTVSLEALIRWQHPQLGLISPDDFIPIVENSSLIKPMTMYNIECAIKKLKELLEKGFDISISVNLSAKLLDDNNLASDITKLLALHSVPADKLTLEITESAAMSNHERTLNILNTLIKNNLKLSIDDFGTSYASFSYLKQLPATELKIDKLFISNICNDNSDKIITSSIISLAHGLNMQVVAEGIEDEYTYNYLKEINCDIAQGYWISKPLPEEKVIPWIINWNNTNSLPDLQSNVK